MQTFTQTSKLVLSNVDVEQLQKLLNLVYENSRQDYFEGNPRMLDLRHLLNTGQLRRP